MNKNLNKNICSESVFERIYNKYSSDVLSFLYYKYGAQYSPNDKMQDAFIKLWENCKKITISKAKSFLFTVVNNMTLNDIKHQKVVLKYNSINKKNYTNETPEFILEKEEYLAHYNTVLSNLKEEQRIAFLLNKVEGKKHKEIAEIMGISTKAVEYRIYTAFNMLKSQIKEFKLK
ncbi:MAG: RNA polymerase sigma factor [Flavobacteriaceae bacterium]|nr:RNA polymerase sigma factor [Flavobacteriaceae bacterium]